MLKKASAKNRIFFIDELRGFSILCMIFYHAFYLFDSFFAWNWADTLFEFFMPVQPLFAGIFIFLCGISCTFSRNNLKRGLILLGIALGFTFVTAVIMPKMDFVGSEIYFGILHFLAVSILIYALFSRLFSRISPISGIILCAVFYPFTSSVADGVFSYGELVSFEIPDMLYKSDVLMPFGIYSETFFSADYFPILPNIFIFLAGVFAGFIFAAKGYPEWAKKKRVPLFGFLGRYTLPIYVVHMPVIYALGFIITLFIN